MPADPLIRELPVNPVNPDLAEHSQPARAKKVIDGPVYIPADGTITSQNKLPVVGTVAGASATLALTQGKAYKVIASCACHIKLSMLTPSATTNDVYLPANTYITLFADYWKNLMHIQAAGASGGIIQAIEVK